METIGERIVTIALELLRERPDGIRYSDLVRMVSESDNTLKLNTIHGNVWDLDQKQSDKVYKPSRGLFRLMEFREEGTEQLQEKLLPKPPKKIKEEDFYKSFADYLQNDLEECTNAIPLGGNKFRDKWGTPDVIGKRESKRSDIIQAPVEIVSAEIKTDAVQLITAFGQACSYRLFSHKSYLVIPELSPQDEVARLDSLCAVFGIGLILFDSAKPQDPQFSIRMRAIKNEPDMFYVNKYMRFIESEMFS